MKTVIELNDDILKITMTIQQKYPELLKYLVEMPATIPNESNPEINCKNLQDYWSSLHSLITNYLKNYDVSKPVLLHF